MIQFYVYISPFGFYGKATWIIKDIVNVTSPQTSNHPEWIVQPNAPGYKEMTILCLISPHDDRFRLECGGGLTNKGRMRLVSTPCVYL